MKKMFVLSVLLVALMALFIPTTSAQDGGCYNLPQADCDYVNAASANTALATSFNQSFTLNVEVTGLEGLAMMAPGTPSSISLQVAGAGSLVMDATDSFPVNFNLPMTVVIDGVEANVRADIVDGVLYFGQDAQVVGIPLDAFFNVMGMDMADLTMSGGGGDMLSGLSSMVPVDDYVNYERLADVDGTSPFLFAVDISGMLQSPEIGSMLGMVGPMLGGSSSDPMVGMLLGALPQIMEGLDLKFDVTQYVTGDNWINKLTMNFDGSIDLDAILGALMGTPGGMGMGTVVIAVDFEVQLGQFNEALTVAAPEGAVILSEEQIQQIFGQLGGLGGMLP
ncbi:MAG: hypothetical protein KJ043_18435 [Anaerolineae bacterium]|nr:hypothetical protein [Anaerolineae bacterium]